MAIAHTQRQPYVDTTDAATTSIGVRRAHALLHVGFVAIPVIAGLDKFTMWLADWHEYLAPVFARMMPFDPHYFMYGAGIVEVIAGLVVAVRPRIGGYLVAAWLTGVVINLLLGGYWDIALRDVGLICAALALAWTTPTTHVRTTAPAY